MELIKAIKEAGVVGAGGAGFPTHVKLDTKVEWFVVNGIECEPLLETDKYLMTHYANELIEIIERIQLHLEAKHAVIGVKNKNVKAIKALSEAIEGRNSPVVIKILGNYYPAGDEHILVQEVCGRTIPPTGLPLDVGAVVSNIATLLDVYKSLENIPVMNRVITVTGEVSNPVLIEVPIGTSIKECLDLAGGTNKESFTVLLGGPIMGETCEKEAVETTFVSKTLGGLIVVDTGSYLTTMKQLPMSHIIKRTESACIQCEMCTDLCPRYLNGHPIYPHKVMRAVGMKEPNYEVLKSALLCCECGVCELYACPMGLSPKTVNHWVKKELLSQGIKFTKNQEEPYEPHDMMPYRKIQTERMMARIGLLKYQNLHPTEMIAYKPGSVQISLKQHIGAPSEPTVQTGAYVEKGTLIGRIKDGNLGANIHASISGVVEVFDQWITIRSDKEQEGYND